MKDKILQIINEKPKHYTGIIKKDSVLHSWVLENSLIESDHYPEMIYSAIHNESNICPNGNKRSVSRISEGWVGCGPANKCICTKEKISNSISNTKLQQSDEIKQSIEHKRVNTMLSKYGVKYNSQRESVKQFLSNPKISEYAYSLLSDKCWITEEYVSKSRSLVDIAHELGVFYGTVAEYCRKHGLEIRQRSNYSLEENKICQYLDILGIKYLRNDWNTLNTKELDIVIPSKNLAIEVNGLYWHSYNPSCKHSTKVENSKRHIDKKHLCNDVGIDLLQFTDYEINHKTDIVKSIIKTKLGLSNKAYARNCIIKNVSSNVEKKFLNDNHIQGFLPSSDCIGLFLNDELLMLMSFSKPRFSKKADLELLRLCTKLDNIVIGGANKLFNEVKKRYRDKTIVSYCDISKFNGNIYKSFGFYLEGSANPGYIWTDGNMVLSRQKCQKKNLAKWLKSFDANKSEADNMFSAGYRRYWDCGQQTWLITL